METGLHASDPPQERYKPVNEGFYACHNFQRALSASSYINDLFRTSRRGRPPKWWMIILNGFNMVMGVVAVTTVRRSSSTSLFMPVVVDMVRFTWMPHGQMTWARAGVARPVRPLAAAGARLLWVGGLAGARRCRRRALGGGTPVSRAVGVAPAAAAAAAARL